MRLPDSVRRILRAATVQVLPTDVRRTPHPYKGEIHIGGLPRILVEQKKGDTRSGVDQDGHPWSVIQPAHYGEFEGTVGTDGDPIDVNVGDSAFAPYAYVIAIKNLKTGKFDEEKFYIGFTSLEEVLAAFRASYDKPGFKLGRTRKVSIAELAGWLAARGQQGKRIDAGVELHKAVDRRDKQTVSIFDFFPHLAESLSPTPKANAGPATAAGPAREPAAPAPAEAAPHGKRPFALSSDPSHGGDLVPIKKLDKNAVMTTRWVLPETAHRGRERFGWDESTPEPKPSMRLPEGGGPPSEDEAARLEAIEQDKREQAERLQRAIEAKKREEEAALEDRRSWLYPPDAPTNAVHPADLEVGAVYEVWTRNDAGRWIRSAWRDDHGDVEIGGLEAINGFKDVLTADKGPSVFLSEGERPDAPAVDVLLIPTSEDRPPDFLALNLDRFPHTAIPRGRYSDYSARRDVDPWLEETGFWDPGHRSQPAHQRRQGSGWGGSPVMTADQAREVITALAPRGGVRSPDVTPERRRALLVEVLESLRANEAETGTRAYVSRWLLAELGMPKAPPPSRDRGWFRAPSNDADRRKSASASALLLQAARERGQVDQEEVAKAIDAPQHAHLAPLLYLWLLRDPPVEAAKGDPSERWITVHPHGENGHGHAVLIRVNPKNPNRGRIIGGAGGSLNHLEIHLKTPAEYRRQAAERRKNQRLKRGLDTDKASRAKVLGAEKERHAADSHELHKQAAQALGWDTEAPEGADPAEHHKRLAADVQRAIKSARDLLVNSGQARAEAGLDPIPLQGDDEKPGAADLLGGGGKRGLGYQKTRADLGGDDLRAEKARSIAHSLDEAVKAGDDHDASIQARRLANHKSLDEGEIEAAAPAALAGIARVVGRRMEALKGATAGEELDEEKAAAIERLDKLAASTATHDDALAMAKGGESQKELREALKDAARLGLLDPDKVERFEAEAERKRFDQVGAPAPDEVTAEQIKDLPPAAVQALTREVALRTRKAGVGGGAGGALHKEAADLGGRDGADSRTVDLEDLIAAKRNADDVQEEAAAVAALGDVEAQRVLLAKAVAAGVLGNKGETPPPDLEKTAESGRDTTINDPKAAARLLVLAGRIGKAKRESANRRRRIERGEEVEGLDYDAENAPKPAGKGGVADLAINHEEVAKVAESLEDRLRTVTARNFHAKLDEAKGQAQAEGQLTDDEVHARLAPHLSTGASTALADHSLTMLGNHSIDRQVVDTLGSEAAAAVLAHAVRKQRPDDVDALAEAVGKYHQDAQGGMARDAEEEARSAYLDAHELHQHMTEEGKSGDLRLWQRLHEQRQGHLDRAEGSLARALGHMEATAALHLALQKAPGDVRAHLGPVDVGTAAKQLRALGLAPEHYRIEHDGENAHAVINTDGLDALVKPTDPESARIAQHLDDIRRGDHDEEGWLPANFARRSEAPQGPHERPPGPSAKPLDAALSDHDNIEDALTSYVGQRVNDGWTPEAILADLQSADHGAAIDKAHAPVDQFDMFSGFGGGGGDTGHDAADLRQRMNKWIDKVFPVNHQGEGDGFRRLAEHSAPVLKNMGAAVGAAGESLHRQSLDPEHAHDATFRALARHPAAVGVFKPASELTHGERAALRDSFTRMNGGDAAEEHMRAWHDAHPEPNPHEEDGGGQDSFDMFATGGGEKAASPEDVEQAHADLQQADEHRRALSSEVRFLSDHVQSLSKRMRGGEEEAARLHAEALPELQRLVKEASAADDAHRVARAKHKRLSQQGKSAAWKSWFEKKMEAHDQARQLGAPSWEAYVRAHGGAEGAYKAVQDIVRGRFLADVKGHHDAATMKPLRAGAAPITGWQGHMHATDPEWREYNDHMRRAAQGAIQARGSAANAGHFAADQVRERIEKRLERGRAIEQQQTTVGTGKEGAERDALFNPGMPKGGHERLTLGEVAEKQIGEIVGQYAPMVDPEKPFSARIGNRMDGKFVHQQRAIKALVRAKKLLMGQGVGAGKTAIAFGTLGELQKVGRARRGLFVVPSAVQGQFGGEALSFLKPGETSWYADPKGDRADRHDAYGDGSKHMVVVTHQSLRDDITRMVAEHHGMSPAEVRDKMVGRDEDGKEIEGWSKEETDAKVAAALKGKGADGLLDFLSVDEGHEGLNRQGKEDSHLARVLDSVGRLSKHTGWFTGSPVKNDASEVFDWLAKVDPEKYNDRAEFMRRYGGDLPGSAQALRRELGRYAYFHKTNPGTDPQEHLEVLQPTEAHKKDLDEIQHAYERARFAARSGGVDVEAAKRLSPDLFDRHDPADHEKVARDMARPLRLAGARDAAISRSVNLHPESAKMAKAVDLAKQYKAAGRPGVIFARSLDAVDRIKEELGKQGVHALTYTGELSTGEKDDTRQRFSGGEGDVLVVSDAGRAGINLQRANWTANYDIPQTFMTQDQRQGRVNRTGQTFTTPDTHHMVLDHPNEHKAVERVQKKKALHEALFEGAGAPLDETGLAPYVRQAVAKKAAPGNTSPTEKAEAA